MNAAKKSPVSSGLIGLPSEICGFKDGEYHPPKSFSGLNGFESHCYNGLFYLLGDFQNSKDFKIYQNRHAPNGAVENPLIIQIYISLLSILSDLRKNPRAVFGKKEEYSLPYRGAINFSKTIIKNFGFQLKTYKTVTVLHTNSLERTFLYYALKKLPSLIDKFVPRESKHQLYKILSECNYLLQEINVEHHELRDLCVGLIRKPNDRGPNSKVLSSCKVLAEFIVQNSYQDISGGLRQQSNARQVEYTDFHLNLNRPFERLLQKIIGRLPKSPLGDVKFSEIHSVSGDLKHTLIPDVYGVMNTGGRNEENCLLIFDAKHKEFASLDAGLSEDDPFTQYNRMNRNDLHQLITYIRTNLVDNTRGIFGFCGFIQESNADYEADFIDCKRNESTRNPDPLSLKVTSENATATVYINVLGLRFGSLLAFIGEACEQAKVYPSLQDDIYDRLAIELANCLYEDDLLVRNGTYPKTVNSCLQGACRSLFFIYGKAQNHLSKIGMHVLSKYLRISDGSEVKGSKIGFIINRESVPHVKIEISPTKALFVIDSVEDPAAIFDAHRTSELFEEYEVNALLTRSGLAIFKNGNGAQPDSLIE